MNDHELDELEQSAQHRRDPDDANEDVLKLVAEVRRLQRTNAFQQRAKELHKKLFFVIDRSVEKGRPLTIEQHRVLNDIMDLLFDVRENDPDASARILAAERGG